ncbi:MAG: RCC1 domain-containing protein [Gemmatimonadales bacterium]
MTPDVRRLPLLVLATLALSVRAEAQRPRPAARARRPAAAARAAAAPRTTWTAVAAGSSFTCALDQTGQGYCWGENVNHKLGISDEVNVRRPRPIDTPQRFESIATGVLDGCGVTREGSLVCWGGPDQGGTPPRSTLGDMRFHLIGLASGGCGVALDASAWCWGLNSVGQLGSGRSTPAPSTGAERVSGGRHWRSVAVAGGYRCALDQDGQAYCWGGVMAGNHNGPNRVGGGHHFQALALGEHHSCGLDASGIALCWGEAHDGSLGTTLNQRMLEPTPVAGGHSFKAIAAGYDFTCAVATDGHAWCWGHNDYGAVGNGTTHSVMVPTQVSGTQTFTAISAGPSHVCAIATDGSLWCWGDNGDGELGIANSQTCRRQMGPGHSEARPCSMVPAKVQDPGR